ncbi:MAG: PPC domain-containing protein [Deltaproteobacteria bacterium]|nr:PPC domain-containing protein [Deltaproteobacteria bacterium]
MNRLATALALATTALSFSAISACTDEDIYEGEEVKSEDGKTDTSALAVFVDFTFQGTLLTDSSFNDTSTVQDQLLYTVGQLNGFNSVGRVDKAVITNITKTSVGGKTQLKYTAKLPVAWGKRNDIPATHELQLPLDISSAGQQAFATKYSHDCVDFGAHDVDAGSMFYYYRPKASRCRLAEADIARVTATVTPSPLQSAGKFPEIDKVWEDGKLEMLAIFGKYEDGATTASDAGVAAYNTFVSAMKQELGARNLTTIPATIPTAPGVGTPDIEFNATLPDGKKIHVVAMLTDNVTTGLSQPAFRARYEALSTRADYIVYNGHAGLGTNVRALAQAGKWVAGQYVVVYMNGCDTFAYIDDALNRAHKAVNPDDTTGFKYIDIVNNAMPAFFHSMSGASMSLFRGLMAYAEPKTYEQIFAGIDRSQVVLVSGEQDNQFTPGGGGTPVAWAGLDERGALTRSQTKTFATPVLAAGTYQFAMTGTGDNDLYVRIGSAPTTTAYDCRPYKTGSNETCSVTLAQPAPVHVMVRGYAGTSSQFELVGKKN